MRLSPEFVIQQNGRDTSSVCVCVASLLRCWAARLHHNRPLCLSSYYKRSLSYIPHGSTDSQLNSCVMWWDGSTEADRGALVSPDEEVNWWDVMQKKPRQSDPSPRRPQWVKNLWSVCTDDTLSKRCVQSMTRVIASCPTSKIRPPEVTPPSTPRTLQIPNETHSRISWDNLENLMHLFTYPAKAGMDPWDFQTEPEIPHGSPSESPETKSTDPVDLRKHLLNSFAIPNSSSKISEIY